MGALTSPAAQPEQILARCCAVIDSGMQVGLQVGAQVYAAVDNRVVADFGRGEARPGAAMTADTIMLWLSASKPVSAAAALQLVERGKLALDEPVATLIPEFAQQGKESITLRHILLHTGGFRWVVLDPLATDWSETIARICAAKLERGWVPGKKAGYHAYSSWYILGELVRRADGRTLGDYVRQELFLPLGMNNSWIGMPFEEWERNRERMGVMLQLEKAEPYPQRYDTPEGARVLAPGGNARGPMHDLGRFYQMLLGEGELDGARVLSPESVRLMTAPQRVGMFDETFRHVMDWGLGTIIDSNRYGADTVPYGYGKYSSPTTFGHGGSQSSVAFADPERKLAAAIVFNGMPGEAKHDIRMRRLLAALYEDLGLD
jgi:CubicO group peptidase (beta-lactamase class C family)